MLQMLSAPAPPGESARLAALHALQILDTPAEERFDRITRLAAKLLDMPIAYVALVDSDRQWFKSACNLPSSQTARSISFCSHTILGDDILEIPDAWQDARFKDSPLVTGEPFVRYYAGFPLRTRTGHKVGTFCVSDHKPRKLFPDQIEVLRELAGMVERELELSDVIVVQDQLISTKDELLRSQQRLAQELNEAAAYVRNLLPAPGSGPVWTNWRFLPCAHLGGDALGYQWVDDDHFAMYLLDVCGHGVGAALLSISVVNVLRTQDMAAFDLRDPAQVLSGLNAAFPMEAHGGQYFTIWYGVFRGSTRTLTYASGGHPPAVLVSGHGAERQATQLGSAGMIVGVTADPQYEAATCQVPVDASLYIFSDGIYEVSKSEGCMLPFAEFVACLTREHGPGGCLDRTLGAVRALSGRDTFEDDVSILEVRFE